jgi:hypothetical protein
MEIPNKQILGRSKTRWRDRAEENIQNRVRKERT